MFYRLLIEMKSGEIVYRDFMTYKKATDFLDGLKKLGTLRSVEMLQCTSLEVYFA